VDITIFILFFSGHRFIIHFSIIKDNESIQIGKNKPIQNNETNMIQYTPRDLCESPNFLSLWR